MQNGLYTYTLTIKGEPMHADYALSEHGLGGDHVHDLGSEQVVRVASRENLSARFNEWFCEDAGREAPFPLGSLLYWAPDDREPMATYRRTAEREAASQRAAGLLDRPVATVPSGRRVGANYRAIGGPDGLLARKVGFVGNSMSAFEADDGTYVVVSYSTVIATWRPGEGASVSERRYSNTTSRQQNLCRAWL